MSKKLVSILIIVALATTMFVGCVKKEEPANTKNDVITENKTEPVKEDTQKDKEDVSEYPNLKGEKVTVYITFHEEEGKRLLELFKQKTGCDYDYIRMPAGEAITRVQAEKDSPKTDIVLGGSAENHEVLKADGILETYIPGGAKDIPDYYKDPDGTWTGMYVGPLAICVNMDRWDAEFKDKGVEVPTSFEELLNPIFKGEIVMPDPATSGTAYTMLASLVQTLGEEKALKYFEQLKPNIAQFTSSGFKPAQMVGTGEYLIGVNFIHDQLMVKKSGFKIVSNVPENAGWEIGAVSLVKNGPNTKAGKAFLDFVTGQEAGQLHTDLTQRLSTRSDVLVPSGVKTLDEMPFYKDYNFQKAGADKKDLQEKFKQLP